MSFFVLTTDFQEKCYEKSSFTDQISNTSSKVKVKFYVIERFISIFKFSIILCFNLRLDFWTLDTLSLSVSLQLITVDSERSVLNDGELNGEESLQKDVNCTSIWYITWLYYIQSPIRNICTVLNYNWCSDSKKWVYERLLMYFQDHACNVICYILVLWHKAQCTSIRKYDKF